MPTLFGHMPDFILAEGPGPHSCPSVLGSSRPKVRKDSTIRLLILQTVTFYRFFSVYTLLVEGYALGASVCHTSVNPGRCKEEARVQGHAATGSVKTHFSNTLVFLFCIQWHFVKQRHTTHMWGPHNCAKNGRQWREGGKLSVQGLFAIDWKCTMEFMEVWMYTRMETQSLFKMSIFWKVVSASENRLQWACKCQICTMQPICLLDHRAAALYHSLENVVGSSFFCF